ncbi:MAG: hypothetical protein AAFY88_17115 [Acidobacteriota bacterium]
MKLIACLLLLVGASQAQAQDEANLGAKETVLRVMQLSQELEKLLASLPPETQEELRRLLMDRLADSADAEPAATDEVAAAPESEPLADEKTPAQVASRVDGVTEPPADDKATAPADPAPESQASTVIARTEDASVSNPPTDATPAAPMPAAPVEPVTPPTLQEPSPSAAPPVPQPAVSRRGACRTLGPFDTDGDGKLTGLDRHWRHFYLWTDVNENRKLDEREIESPYDRGIREIDVALRSFVRGKGKRKRALEIQLEEYILLDVGGDGWSGADPRGDDGALAVDASALRKAGGPDLRDSRGRALEGVLPFRPGLVLRLTDGTEIVANCPKG